MKRKLLKRICLAFTLCLSLSIVGCQKTNENNKAKEGQSVTSEEAGMSTSETDTFKPSDYTLKAKDEYIYEYLGFKFKLSDKIRKDILDKKIAMLDNQSPIDQELKYAILTFSNMSDEQKNSVVNKMGDGYEKWQNGLERLGTIGMFLKDMSEKDISTITNCDIHKKIGDSSDGKYTYYISSRNGANNDFVEEFNKTKIDIIEKKERPENGFVLAEKSDLENTEAFGKESVKDLHNISTSDINGKEFSSKDFENYNLTMVNVFSTWCTACIKEIPDLVKVQNEMKSKGVNIVGIVTDTIDDNGENKEAIEKAKLIQEKTNASYPFLIPDKTNFNGRLNGIQALPETFFVDKNGNIVGDTYSGAKNTEEWKKVIEKELENIKNK